MPGFFAEFAEPRCAVVDPRKNVKLHWYYYYESGDAPLQYYLVQWKRASVAAGTWEYTYMVKHPNSDYLIPANTLKLDDYYTWKVTAYVISQATETLGQIVEQGSMQNSFDTSGYTMRNFQIVGTSASGTIGWAANQPIDPGEYDVRVKVRNGFVWSAWTTGTVKAYDTSQFVFKNGRWQATPIFQKKSTGMVSGKRN